MERKYSHYIGRARKDYQNKRRAVIKIQSKVKGFLMKKRYKEGLALLKKRSCEKINALVVGHKVRKKYKSVKKIIARMQANFFSTQCRRSYLKLRKDAILCQAYIRRFLAVTWYRKIHTMKKTLEDKMDVINDQIGDVNNYAKEFREVFVNKSISGPLKYLTSFNQYQEKITESSHHVENQQLKQENQMLKTKINIYEEETKDTAKLKVQMGPKYNELQDNIEQLKISMKRVTEESKKANILSMKLKQNAKIK